ncbi:MAG: ADP-ribosylglycohydrolase family protein [bacterium]
MSIAKTSDSHPIRVDWLPTPFPGRIGLTFAPGKKDPSAATGAWDRDLRADLQRLNVYYGASHLVSLLEPDEFDLLQIANLTPIADELGLSVRRFPIPDGTAPRDVAAVKQVVAEIIHWAQVGESVVIHCRGGLGRAGTIGGCVLRMAGHDPQVVFAELNAARGPNCPETSAQRAFVQAFPAAPTLAERVAGSTLGAAIGDALGHPTEFSSYEQLSDRYGAGGVKTFELWWDRDGKRFAPYTDDTQMAEIVFRALVDFGTAESSFEAAMAAMATGFASWRDHPQGGHRAPGNSCMAGAASLARGVPWREAGSVEAGGCGSVMRTYPFGLLMFAEPLRAERWAVEHSRMTHGAPIALAACAAMAVGMASETAGVSGELALEAMVAGAAHYDLPTARMCEQAVVDARNGTDAVEVLRRLQGWAADEAIAAAMFVVARHPDDIRAALLEGANASGDSDSIATLAGALLGSRHGIQALPVDWIQNVERSEELLALAAHAVQLIDV